MSNDKSQELNAVLGELAQRYAEAASSALGERLTSIALYGSVARNAARPTSDIDLFIVLKEVPQGMMRRRALLDPVRKVLTPQLEQLWNQGIYTDFVEIIRSEAEAKRFHPLYLDMTNEAKLLYDSEGFLEGILQRVRRRLKALGSERRPLGHGHYWDLNPKLKPGEVVEL